MQELIAELAEIDIALASTGAQQRRESLRGPVTKLTVLVLRQRAICQELRRRGNEHRDAHCGPEGQDEPLATVHQLRPRVRGEAGARRLGS